MYIYALCTKRVCMFGLFFPFPTLLRTNFTPLGVISPLLKMHALREFPGGPVVGLRTSTAGGPGSIPGWGTSSRMHTATKSAHAATKKPTCHNYEPTCRNKGSCMPKLRSGAAKINKYFLKKEKKMHALEYTSRNRITGS